MSKVNPKNEALKVAWMKALNRDDTPSTVDHKLAALALFEEATDYLDFDKITVDAVDAVDEFIAVVRQRPTRSRTNASLVNNVKGFFNWLVMDERMKGKRANHVIKALRLPKRDRTAARSTKRKEFATLEQITQTITAMPKASAIERRNRALIAFTLLSGARDGAIISMRLKHVDTVKKEVLQDPNEVDTKAGKEIHTWFFPVGEPIIDEIMDYISFLKDELSFTDEDPLFPSTARAHDKNDCFIASGLTKKRWASAQPMRDIFKSAFKAAGFKYYKPHSFRNTLMALAYERRLDGEALKAWSQNLGHEKLDTSINSYGPVTVDRQRARIMEMHEPETSIDEGDKPLTRNDLMDAFKAMGLEPTPPSCSSEELR